MNMTSHYNFSQGLSVISPYGLQKYTEKLDSYSSILNNIYSSDYNKNNKYCIDSCLENGNIYYANYDEGYVKKIKFDGTVIATLNLSRPFMVSIIQNSLSMNTIVSYPPQDEIGCWIADRGTGKIIKTDNNLNILKEIDYIVNPIGLIADIDGGCYVVSYYITSSIKGNLLKISSDGEVVGIKNYYDFSPQVTGFIDISIDSNGQVYFCANDNVYSLTYSEGNILQNYVISPITTDDPFSSSSSQVFIGEEKHVGCIDIDRNSQYQPLYIAGGNSSESFIVKYIGGSLVAQKQYYDMGMPYVIKAIQGMGSDSLYVLEDSSKWDDYGYGSSSSIDSSSSSSSKSSSSNSSTSSSSYSSDSSESTSSSSEQDYWIWTQLTQAGARDWKEVVGSDDGEILYAITSSSGYILTSTDAGYNWIEKTNSGSLTWNKIRCSDDGTMVAACVDGGNVYLSSDSGDSWATSTMGAKQWTDIAISGNGQIISACVRNEYIWTSWDYGVTFYAYNTVVIGSKAWTSIDISKDGTKFVAGSTGYIYTSTDSGLNWNSCTSGGSRPWTDVCINYNGARITASYWDGGSSGGIHASNDSGVTWASKISFDGFSCVDCDDSGDFVSAGMSFFGYMYSSENVGENWNMDNIGYRYWKSIFINRFGNKKIAAGIAAAFPAIDYLWSATYHLIDNSSSSSSS